MTGLPPSRCRRPSRYCSCRSLFCGLCSSLTNSLPHDLGEGCCHIERAAGVQVDNTLTQAHKTRSTPWPAASTCPPLQALGAFQSVVKLTRSAATLVGQTLVTSAEAQHSTAMKSQTLIRSSITIYVSLRHICCLTSRDRPVRLRYNSSCFFTLSYT